ncbi:MAG: Hsp70 family protein, partial [Acidobacteria bacterium]|nr:Hsp70 family protein [Acidobacteriota bacterium]
VEIHVLQGEREISKDNKSLGKFSLVGIPAAPRGVPQIEVTFAIDSNGIVSVSARDKATNASQSIQINPASGLSQDEIDRLVEEATQYAQEDNQRREIRRLKNRLEGMIETNDRVFEQFRNSMSGDDQKRINEALLKARISLSSEDQADLEASMYDLASISGFLSEVMLDRSSSR